MIPNQSRVTVAGLAATVLAVLTIVAMLTGVRLSETPRIYLFDVPLVVVALTRVVIIRFRRPHWYGGIVLAAGFWLVVSLAWHPTVDGAIAVGRLLAGAALALAVADAIRKPLHCRILLGGIVLAGGFEAILAVAQAAEGAPLGLALVGETKRQLFQEGSAFAPRGTFRHQYVLAGFLLVCATTSLVIATDRVRHGTRNAAVLVVFIAVPVGLTFSRTALVALCGIGATAAWALRRGEHKSGVVLAGIVVAAGLGILLSSSGWQSKLSRTSTTDAESLGSGRVAMAQESVRVSGSSPLVGVGPARYEAIVLERRSEGYARYTVHNVVLLVTAESGVTGGALVAASLSIAVLAGVRAGPSATAVVASLMPFVMLDYFPYKREGVVISALWAGTLLALVSGTRGSRPAASRTGLGREPV